MMTGLPFSSMVMHPRIRGNEGAILGVYTAHFGGQGKNSSNQTAAPNTEGLRTAFFRKRSSGGCY